MPFLHLDPTDTEQARHLITSTGGWRNGTALPAPIAAPAPVVAAAPPARARRFGRAGSASAVFIQALVQVLWYVQQISTTRA
jgi:3-oxoacyl-ACP reductase-like protein